MFLIFRKADGELMAGAYNAESIKNRWKGLKDNELGTVDDYIEVEVPERRLPKFHTPWLRDGAVVYEKNPSIIEKERKHATVATELRTLGLSEESARLIARSA